MLVTDEMNLKGKKSIVGDNDSNLPTKSSTYIQLIRMYFIGLQMRERQTEESRNP